MKDTARIHRWLMLTIAIIFIASIIIDSCCTTKENFYTGASGLFAVTATAIMVFTLLLTAINILIGVLKKRITFFVGAKYFLSVVIMVLILGAINNAIWRAKVSGISDHYSQSVG